MLTPLERQLINRLQGGFPLVPRPFALAASWLACDEESLLQRLEALLASGALSRFGPLYNAERMGGAVTLAAMQVPTARFDAVVAQVNAFPEVAHNYAREHAFNLWFVVASAQGERIAQVLEEIAVVTALPVYNMPKLEEYRLGFGLRLEEGGAVGFHAVSGGSRSEAWSGDGDDERLIAATQEGLPLVVEPYRQVGEQVGLSQEEVLARFERMLASGVIRRLGVIPNHYRLGLTANGMTVWDVADEQVQGCGVQMAGFPFVSHCYRRPRHEPLWRYNLFAMVHGESRAQVEEQAALMADRIGAACREYRILYSNRLLKKSGLRVTHP